MTAINFGAQLSWRRIGYSLDFYVSFIGREAGEFYEFAAAMTVPDKKTVNLTVSTSRS
jgi:hypothetical protein